VPFSVDLKLRSGNETFTAVCSEEEDSQILYVIEECLNYHYFDLLPDELENITFVMEGYDPTMNINYTDRSIPRSIQKHWELAMNRSHTKRDMYEASKTSHETDIKEYDESSSSWNTNHYQILSPDHVYDIDNSIDCKYRNIDSMCTPGAADYCIYACGYAIPTGPRNDTNVTEYLYNTNTTNHNYLPISQWNFLGRVLGSCVRQYINVTNTTCLGDKDKLTVELDTTFVGYDIDEIDAQPKKQNCRTNLDSMDEEGTFNTTFMVTFNVEPHGDVLTADNTSYCTEEQIDHELNVTTTNMTMIMMDYIAQKLANQTVYIEEFADYYKCPTYRCDYGKKCSIYCSEVTINWDGNCDNTYAWRELSSLSFDNIKVLVLDDLRELIEESVIFCNKGQRYDNFMIQYYVSTPNVYNDSYLPNGWKFKYPQLATDTDSSELMEE